jgi:hypothetical protein
LTLEEILEKEEPAAVLFMSVDTFSHRAFNRYCKKHAIPTIHLYHGVVSVQDLSRASMYRVNALAQIRFAGSKLGKALRHVWPAYSRSLWTTKAGTQDWLRFGADITRLTRGNYIPIAAQDARTDRCAVYTEADRQHAIVKYQIPSRSVVAVGNPDLVKFGLNSDEIGCRISNDLANTKDVLYIDTGLIFTGWVYDNVDDFVEHIVATKAELHKQGYRLIIKPHPQHYRGSALERIASAGVAICRDDDFVPQLRRSCACIVEPSSAALVPALFGLPLLLAQYGKLSGCRYGKLLHHYPRSQYIRRVSEFSSLINKVDEVNKKQLSEWIRLNAGPLPAERMPERVAELFRGLLETTRNELAASYREKL